MNKFKVGDKVVSKKNFDGLGIRAGDRGIVVKSIFPLPENMAAVKFERRHKTVAPAFGEWTTSVTVRVSEDDLFLLEKSNGEAEIKPSFRRLVFQISDEGGTAKYMDGKNTLAEAEVKRYKDDKPDDVAAVLHLLEKMFPEKCKFGKPADAEDCETPGYISVTLKDDGSIVMINAAHIDYVIPGCADCGHGCSIALSCGDEIECAEPIEIIMGKIGEAGR